MATDRRTTGSGSTAVTEQDALLMLLSEPDRTPRARLAVIAGLALLLHGILFLVRFPAPSHPAAPPPRTSETPVIRRLPLAPPPPPPPVRERPRFERALPVPDPTPEEPEPLVEPAPVLVPDLPEVDPELIGVAPEPPPAGRPLVAGAGGVTRPELIEGTAVQPVYPELARRVRVEGVVRLQAVVRADGTVGELRVLSEEPEGLGFARAAEDAVRQWRYHPAHLGKRPVDVWTTIVVRFRLE
ncbi:MAG: energy transducer TonB [Acidobacteria bacterium]|nr:MAG: energy transducer TonB [Acidobacteriota bacterium]